MAANLNFLKLLKKIAFYPNRIFLLQKFIGWYIESDTKINILTIWALWRVAIETIWIREPWSPSECSGNQIALETTSLLLQACTVLRLYMCDSFIFRNKKKKFSKSWLSQGASPDDNHLFPGGLLWFTVRFNNVKIISLFRYAGEI